MTLTTREIHLVVEDYIGVSGGYLGDFTYRTHQQFYVAYCDLDIDVQALRERDGGTTRELFIQILRDASPEDQASILRGVIEKYPPGSGETRSEERAARIKALAERLLGLASTLPTPPAAITHEGVLRAVADAEQLIASNGAISALDRVHTVASGYLRHVASVAGIALDDDPSMTAVWKALLAEHPILAAAGHRADEIHRLLRSASSIFDALNTLRNRGSVAHVNELVGEAEARLAINITRSLLHYLAAKADL